MTFSKRKIMLDGFLRGNHRSASAGCLQMKHQKPLVLFKKNGLFPRICLLFLGICLVLQCINGASAGQFYSMNSPLQYLRRRDFVHPCGIFKAS
ncbi:CLUMA_CG013463, isoform A [Clunio marinus]|uniref:CLUMA_CG013463, isoform A n=1 Tax=Clunio marinus TaxID=568069 RepID=A0A1J1IIX5_9DIPT|nr:CLUMA_CG013463, isoform A [Clunio marinus]